MKGKRHGFLELAQVFLRLAVEGDLDDGGNRLADGAVGNDRLIAFDDALFFQ